VRKRALTLLVSHRVRVYKTKDDQITGFSCSAEWQVGHPAHKNPMFVPVIILFFLMRSPDHPVYLDKGP